MIIPVIAGVISWMKFSTISIKEAGVSVGTALVLIMFVLGVSECSVKSDTETLSGRVVTAVHIPRWEAEWEELETYTTTDSEGNTETHTRWVTRHETHYPKWWVETTIGDISISENFFKQISKKHGIVSKPGHRPDYDSGDRNDYFSYVKDDPEYCDYPVTLTNSWQNPLIGTENLYSYKDISEQEARKLRLFSYPENNTFCSSRLVGNTEMTIWDWDKMNAALGAEKHINLILVKLPNGIEQAKNLQAYWKNGKKNDIVICYGGEPTKPAEWCYVFGWSKSELVKQNLQTLLLDKPVNDDIIPDIKRIVRRDFRPHDWTMYRDTAFLIPTGWVITAFILMIAAQIGLYYQFHKIDL
jgi:hypothetical protein